MSKDARSALAMGTEGSRAKQLVTATAHLSQLLNAHGGLQCSTALISLSTKAALSHANHREGHGGLADSQDKLQHPGQRRWKLAAGPCKVLSCLTGDKPQVQGDLPDGSMPVFWHAIWLRVHER